MSANFLIDNISHYVWALSQKWPSNPDGYDIRYMAGRYHDVHQASLETLDELIEQEDRLNAKHQQFYWLNIDGAADAVGMMEGDGHSLSTGGRVSRGSYNDVERRRKIQAHVSLVKTNVERVKDHYRNVPLAWEAVATDPEAMKDAILAFNEFNNEIVDANRFEAGKNAVIHEFATMGSGVVRVHHDARMAIPDNTWFEEKIRQGVALEWDEYTRLHKLVRSHIIEYVDTFEIIRSRFARGEKARDFSSPHHNILSRIQPMRVTEACIKYPDKKDRIQAANCPIYEMINPQAIDIGRDDAITYLKETWIRCPVRYELSLKVHVGSGIYKTIKKQRTRYATIYVARLENVGIVDMNIDKYAHNGHEFEQCIHTPSSKHGCGIGLAKYGRDSERIYNIMLNGQLRFFDRMIKGGGFFYKGVIDQNVINQRTKEQVWIEIDPDGLPVGLRGKPLSELIQDSRPQQMPIVYDQLMMRAEDATNRTMMVPDASRGIKQGNSGRQELVLKDQAERVMSTGVAALESMMPSLGTKVHSNIVQYTGSEIDILFKRKDPATNAMITYMLNYVSEIEEMYDPIKDDWEILPKAIKNNLLTMEFTTQLATRSIVPTNPTDRRLFYQELSTQILPLLSSPEGIAVLQFLNTFGFGGVRGMDEMIDKLVALKSAAQESQQNAMQQSAMRQEKLDAQQQANEEVKAEQNLMRLINKFTTDLKKIEASKTVS